MEVHATSAPGEEVVRAPDTGRGAVVAAGAGAGDTGKGAMIAAGSEAGSQAAEALRRALRGASEAMSLRNGAGFAQWHGLASRRPCRQGSARGWRSRLGDPSR